MDIYLFTRTKLQHRKKADFEDFVFLVFIAYHFESFCAVVTHVYVCYIMVHSVISFCFLVLKNEADNDNGDSGDEQ